MPGGLILRQWRLVGVAAIGLASIVTAPPLRADAARPTPESRESGLQERVEVRLVQVAVSVMDPRSDSYRSVEGLTLDQFVIRLNGLRLGADQGSKVMLDPICGPAVAPTGGREPTTPAERAMIAVVDFNYLDSAGRFKAAQALEWMADSAPSTGHRVKVYAITRQVRLLTPGFTSDPQQLREAAKIVRAEYWRQAPGDTSAGDSGRIPPPEQAAVSPADSGGSFLRLDKNSAVGLEVDPRFQDSGAGAYDAGASIAALEAILRSNAAVPGRKIVVLFSSESFRPRRRGLEQEVDSESRGDWALEDLLPIARRGFSFWTVDAGGLSPDLGPVATDGGSSVTSDIMSALAHDTGGKEVRSTNDLSTAFKGAMEQLSCYYLFSVPVRSLPDRTMRYTLDIALDTERFPELFRLRVQAPSQVYLPSRTERVKGDRIAALFAPDDFKHPPVNALLDYPRLRDGKPSLTARFRVPLSELTWEPLPGGGIRARVLVDALVERDTGLTPKIECEVGSEKTGELVLGLPTALPAGVRRGLAVEIPCEFKRDGLYTTRGVVTDEIGDAVGGGRSTALIRSTGTATWQALALRVEGSSGKDFVWRPGMTAAKRDRRRTALRDVSLDEPADVSDRLVFRYVLCGPDRSVATRAVRHVLARARDGGPAVISDVLPAEALELAQGESARNFCAEASVSLDPDSLEPGRYTFAVMMANAPPPAENADAAPPQAVVVLAQASFAVAMLE